MKHIEVRGSRVPVLGLGTWELVGRACEEAVATALEMGYRHLDTAQMYGNEKEVGRGLAASGVPREEVFVTTKLWMESLGREQVHATTRRSLERLGTAWVDLLLIHWPNPAVPLAETLGAMVELVEAGLVRHLGVSNFPPSQVEEALDLAPLVCNQVEFHPYLSQGRQLAMARERDLALVAYCPLARGQVTSDTVLERIGARHDKSPAQVTLRWLLQHDRVAAVPKASSREHLRENLQVFDFTLEPDEMRRISSLATGRRLINPGFAPAWES